MFIVDGVGVDVHQVYVTDVGWDRWILRRRSTIEGLIPIMLDS